MSENIAHAEKQEMMSEDIARLMKQNLRLIHMFGMCEVVRKTGKVVLGMTRDQMHDTVEVDKHVFSNADAVAGSHLRSLVATCMSRFSGHLMEECDIARALRDREELYYPLLICDAAEGSTNTKRGLASIVRRPILAGTSMVLIENKRMSTVAASAFYDFASDSVYSSVRGEAGSFMSFIDGKVQEPGGRLVERYGDSQQYATVAGYSNNNIGCVADIIRVLQQSGIRWSGGTRSSAQDLLEILGNQVDCYVDLRALFPGNTDSRDETLHFWDVGGLLPFLDGLGYEICDHKGRPWQEFFLDEKLALIVCRPSMGKNKIVDAISQLRFVQEPDPTATVLPMASGSGK